MAPLKTPVAPVGEGSETLTLTLTLTLTVQEFKSDKSMLALSLFGIIDWRPKEKPLRYETRGLG